MKKLLLLLFVFCLFIPLSPKAKMELKTRSDVFSFLKDAFHAQVALSEKGRSMAEIKKIVDPYFSDEYQKVFEKENIVKVKGKYITYGSDFARYYIPFYKFSDKTRVVFKKNKIYVFEYFPESKAGPVGYKSHYEGILLEYKSGNWKVSKYLFDKIPSNIIRESIH
ncbi:MAG: DUF3993 domain-containing protein [Bacillota bacterium]|nr:DUF3993 domain-containing protein [Bacillota bacterium]